METKDKIKEIKKEFEEVIDKYDISYDEIKSCSDDLKQEDFLVAYTTASLLKERMF